MGLAWAQYAEKSAPSHAAAAAMSICYAAALLDAPPVLKVSWLIRIAQAAFFAALIFTFYSAVIPPRDALQLVPWDKAEHFIAFYGLTGLAVAAFPRRNLFILAAVLSGFGAFIEYVQGLDIVHRDRDFWDWVADTIAIGAALAPMILVWWRGVVRSGQKNIDM